VKVENHKRQTVETRTAHLDLTTPCDTETADASRLARDLGLEGPLQDEEVVGVCLPYRAGARCNNSSHLFVGTEDEAKAVRLAHLLAQQETHDLSSRKLGLLAGVSHAAVQRLRRKTKTEQGEQSETETV
jgi:hypothetical protein